MVGLQPDDSQVQEINCSTFQIRKGCRTHEELKVLVSKSSRKYNESCKGFGILGVMLQEKVKY